MDLGEEERYAAAALFTLALHMTQVDAGIAPVTDVGEVCLWGEPEESLQDDLARAGSASKASEVATARLALFWGWDFIAEAGMLDTVYGGLQIPGRSWRGLKQLPALGGLARSERRSYLKMTAKYVDMLDSTIDSSSLAGPEVIKSSQPAKRAPSHPLELSSPSEHSSSDDTDPPAQQTAEPQAQPSQEAVFPLAEAALPAWEAFTAQAPLQEAAVGPRAEADADLAGDLQRLRLQRRLSQRRSSQDAASSAAFQHMPEVPLPQPSAPSPAAWLTLLASRATVGSLPPQPAQQPSQSPPLGVAAANAAGNAPSQARSSAQPSAAEAPRDSAGSIRQLAADPAPFQPQTAVTSRSAAEQCNLPDPGASARAEREAREAREARQAHISPVAVAAVWALLQGCLARPTAGPLPAWWSTTATLLPAGLRERSHWRLAWLALQLASGVATDPSQPRWRHYDARARVALRCMAAWVRVPWRKLEALERMAALQAAEEPSVTSGPATPASTAAAWQRSIRNAKIAGAVLGAGTLFAVTGGLAAPALAAGLGAAITMVGGAAGMGAAATATAGSVTGFLASGMGTAVLASGLGAAGGSFSGSRLAHLIGEIKEFGFWQILPGDQDQPQDPPPQLSSSSSRSLLQQHQQQQQGSRPSSPSKQQQQQQQRQQTDAGRVAEQAAHSSDAGNAHWPHSAASKPSQAAVDPLQDTQQPGTEAAHPSWSAGHSADLLKDTAGLEQEVLAGAGLSQTQMAAIMQTRRPCLDPVTGPATVALAQAISAADLAQRDSTASSSGQALEHDASNVEAYQPLLSRSDSDLLQDSSLQGSPRTKARRREAMKDPPLSLAPLPSNDMPAGLALTIGVAGWVAQRSDFATPWRAAGISGELHSLVWESQDLIALNRVLLKFVTTQAAGEVTKFALTHFFYTGLVAATAGSFMLLSFAQLIDHPWAVCMDRAQKAGQRLAILLLAGGHADRPVTLIGHSFGAMLIFHCLLELSRCRALGIVEHAVLLGTPVGTDGPRWTMARQAVAGRLVNGYTKRDWVLASVYRATSAFSCEAAGLAAVPCPGVENVNLSSLVGGHFDYMPQLREIMDVLALSV